MEEDFDLEPPEDDDDISPDVEVKRGLDSRQ
jgi:hypothetical protein